jgi:hypothetical protein
MLNARQIYGLIRDDYPKINDVNYRKIVQKFDENKPKMRQVVVNLHCNKKAAIYS